MTTRNSSTTAEVSPPQPLRHPAVAWLDGLADGCLLADRGLTVVCANAAFAAPLGRPADELAGRPLAGLFPGGAAAPACRVALAALEAGGSPEADEEAGGRWFHLRARAVPGGVVLLRADVSERRRADAERARLEEHCLLVQKRESLGVLASGVAHGINNLLSAIVCSAGLLRRELPAGGDQHGAAVLIEQAAERAAEVTRQMLVYAGKTVPVRRPLDLSAVVRDNLPLLTAALPRRCYLETRLAAGLPVILADAGQLQQAVLNLLVNAGEAGADEGGRVVLATGAASEAGAAHVYLEVADDGCGIPPEVRSRVFDPFFSTKGRGRGLGLSAVQGIARVHGGQVRLTSEPGRGTTFRVLLPVRDPDTARPAERGTEATAARAEPPSEKPVPALVP